MRRTDNSMFFFYDEHSVKDKIILFFYMTLMRIGIKDKQFVFHHKLKVVEQLKTVLYYQRMFVLSLKIK